MVQISSLLSSHCGKTIEQAINARPLVIAFRGHALDKVMRQHRVSKSDLNGALRKSGIWNISQIEVVIIEPTGDFTIYQRCQKPAGIEPEVLLEVPAYRRLVEHFDHDKMDDLKPGSKHNGQQGSTEEIKAAQETANDIAAQQA